MPEKRIYSVGDDFAEAICRAIGVDPHRVTAMKFDWEAWQLDAKPLTIEITYLPEFSGDLELHPAILQSAVPIKEDDIEAGYHASET